MKQEIILSTIHGSKLYGLNHEHSDSDTYSVYAGKGRSSQRIVQEHDDTLHSLETFVRLVNTGTHQALEALWSPYAYFDSSYEPFLKSLSPNPYMMYQKYKGAISSFAQRNDFKGRRHSLRLMAMLAEYNRNQYFNPALNDNMKDLLNYLSSDTILFNRIFDDFFEGKNFFERC